MEGNHTTEDVALCLGAASGKALGERAGIRRYGSTVIPMDEARVACAIDLSGRSFLAWRVPLPKTRVGDFDTELTEVFFEAFARACGCTLHVVLEEGSNHHHIIEACFKAFARALREAVQMDPRARGVPSTKGMLT